MFPRLALTGTVLAAAAVLIVRADVTPSVPGPDVVYQVGGTCHIVWQGDTTSTSAWKNMSIQLMTGDNFDMISLQTVATNLDGTVSGTFDHTCPNVTPNSAIYFYQFTAPGAPEKQWTTRFTIASSTGATTPPANPTQSDGQRIPWGTGTLVSAGGSANSAAVSTAGLLPSASTLPAGSSAPATTLPAATIPGSGTMVTVTLAPSSTALHGSKGPNTNTTTGTTAPGSSAAASLVVLDSRIWSAFASLMAFAVLL